MYPPYNLPTFPMLVPGCLGALAWLGASRRKVGSRPTLHSGVILHRGLIGAFTRVTALVRERPGRPVIGDVLFHGLALTKQALDNSLSETGIAIRFSESVYLFRSPGTCYSGPSESVKQSVHRFR